MKPLWVLAAACASCALPVVSAGTFLPAGDLKKGELHASVSMEAGRVLAGPSDINDGPAAPETRKWEVATWVASDASLRWQSLRRLSLEAQVKMSNPIVPFVPSVVGGAIGARVRLLERDGAAPGGVSLELGTRLVGVRVREELERRRDARAQIDRWTYRALGVEMPLVATYRISPLFAVTASPFLRAYWIRIWHDTFFPDDRQKVAQLEWTPVLAGGLGLSGAIDLGPIEFAPSVAFELATRAGPTAPTKLLFEPGISVGTRF